MEAKERNDIISSYGATLLKFSMSIKSETVLPYSKGVIRRAIIEELLYASDSKNWDVLANGFLQLEDFVTQDEFKVVEPFIEPYEKFLMSHRDLEKKSAIGGQQLALEMKKIGFDIVTNVQKQITERMHKRAAQLNALKEMINEL